MKRLATLICLAVLAPGIVNAQKQFTLVATISDPSGAAIATLDPSRVSVTEGGTAARVVKVEPVNRVPKLHLLVDNGIGLPAESLADLRKGLHGLVDAVPAGVQLAVVTTAPQPRFVERGTDDRGKMHKAIDLIAADTGAGRFVESLYEATERIEKDKDSNNVIVSVATSSGDLRVREGDVKKILDRLAAGRTRVHVALFTGRAGSSLGGDMQLQLGEAATKATAGRFEVINGASRLASLLPELGAEAGKTLGGAGARQFRITAERPAGASGDYGRLSMGVTGMLVTAVTVESR